MTLSDSTPTSSDSSASTPASFTPYAGTYPHMGHASDYSWIAGKVAFTKIQGSCVYIRTEESPAVASASIPTPGGMIVGTAVSGSGSESQPLRDITPIPPEGSASQGPIGPSFVPTGAGWNEAKVQDGDYVLLFGHVAGPGDPREMCPGGTPYVADTMQRNP